MKGMMMCLLLTVVVWAGDILDKADRLYDEGNPKEALGLYEQACDQNIPKACYRLGFIYENKQKVKQDFKKAFALYQRACESGSARGCYKVAVCYDTGGIVKQKQDFNIAETYYKKSCDGGFGLACYSLGSLYQYTLGGSHNEEKMRASYQKACQKDTLLGCYKVAYYYQGKDRTKEAKKWFKIGCDKDDTQACFRLVDIYIKELSVLQPKEFNLEIRDYRDRCNKGDTMGCYKLATMYSTGRGLRQSYRKAKELFVRGCEMGDNASCMEAYMMIESGF